MTKLRVLVLCSSYFTDNSNSILGCWVLGKGYKPIEINYKPLVKTVCREFRNIEKNFKIMSPFQLTGKETFTHILQSHQDPSFIKVKEIRCRVEPLGASILKIRGLRSPPSDFWNVPHPWAVPDQGEGYYTYFLRVQGMVHL
jgi:hypothetical protein